jgi:hypothetical protein
MLFILPNDVYWRFEKVQGNKQSQLLQEVKGALVWTFPTTPLRADGPVIAAPFISYHVEVLPAFRRDDGTYVTGHTSNGGSWRLSNPVAEYQELQYVDQISAGKGTQLNKMIKAWRRECTVDIKSISLEKLVNVFIEQWYWRNQTLYYYDWMVRDFFEFLLRYVNGRTQVPGTSEWNDLGDSWASKCQSAYDRAVKVANMKSPIRPSTLPLNGRNFSAASSEVPCDSCR